jgi:hypothetical protein
MKTHQETFNIVYKNLKTQNDFSTNFKGECAYRGVNGKKCAAGWLIPDEKYNSALEEAICWNDFDDPNDEPDYDYDDKIMNIMQILQDEGHDPKFVRELQIIHDENIRWGFQSWESDMRNLAEEYDFIIEK